MKKLSLYRHILRTFIIRELKGRYVGSVMGIFWSVIYPLILMVVYVVIFSVILKVKLGGRGGTENFGIFLFCGMLPWLHIQDVLPRSASSLIENAQLLKHIPFPPAIIPLSVVLSGFVYELIALILFVGIIIILGVSSPGFYFFGLIPILIIQVFFVTGLSFMISALNVFFRDVGPLVGALLPVWFFATPIVYPPDIIPLPLLWVIKLNPLYSLVNLYRDCLLERSWPSLPDAIYFFLFSVMIYTVGYIFFKKVKNKLVDAL